MPPILNIEGYCPACGERELHRMSGGMIQCLNRSCPGPGAVQNMLMASRPPDPPSVLATAADLLAAEDEGRPLFLRPMLMHLGNVLHGRGLKLPYRVELEITAADDSSLQMTLERAVNQQRIRPIEVTPSFYRS